MRMTERPRYQRASRFSAIALPLKLRQYAVPDFNDAVLRLRLEAGIADQLPRLPQHDVPAVEVVLAFLAQAVEEVLVRLLVIERRRPQGRNRYAEHRGETLAVRVFALRQLERG